MVKGKYIRTIEIKKKNSISNIGKSSGEKNYWFGKNRSGKNNPMYGKKHSIEAIEKQRKAKKDKYCGKNNPFYGKHHTEKTKKIISEKEMGKIDTIETCIKKSLSKKLDKHPNWKGGISFEPYCFKFNKQLKEQIRNRDNRNCQLCGKSENELNEKLSVHHIHYDKENCYPDLISLCRSDNTKVNFNREYWEEYFINNLKNRDLLNYFNVMI